MILSQLRRGVLAVSVLTDLDVRPDDDGVTLPGQPDVRLDWPECRAALGDGDPEGAPARERLGRWLWARRRAADLPVAELAGRLRAVGLPIGHLLHPGPGWVRERVLGGALELGLGAVGLDPRDPDAVAVLPPTALPSAAAADWPAARTELERLGAVAAELLAGDVRGRLRPVGAADVVTLLGARTLRAALAAPAGGQATPVVPMRTRGWTRLSLLDPAFGPAAAAATDPAERGFPRPLLVTADEVTVAAAGGRPQVVALSQPAACTPWDRAVLCR